MDDARLAGRKGLRPNNFDLIRLAAALQVVLVHSVENLGLALPAWMEPLTWFPGVPIFFVLSGFLVSLSYERSPTVGSYAANRLLRIFPALWVCFLSSVASVACLRPDLLGKADPATLAAWLAAQVSVGQVFNPSFLREYGVGALNGSLWTIPVELQFYAVVPIVYVACGLHRSSRLKALMTLILIFLLVNRGFAAWKDSSGSLPMKLCGATFVPHVWYFLVGVLVQRKFGRLRSLFDGNALWWLSAHLVCCAGLSPLGWHVGGNLIGPVPSLTLIGVTFSAAYTRPALSERLLRHNDISYGTYLYHMVIINALIELGRPATWSGVAVVFAATIACALLSWHLIERPALALKSLFQRPAIPTFEIGLERRLPSLPPHSAGRSTKPASTDEAPTATHAGQR